MDAGQIITAVFSTLGGSAALAGAVAGGVKLVQWWRTRADKLAVRKIASEEKRELARIAAEGEEAAREDDIASWLRERIEKTDARIQSLEDDRDTSTKALVATQSLAMQVTDELRKCEVARTEEREELHECQRAREELAARVDKLELRVAAVPKDITGKIQIEARREVRRSLSQPGMAPIVEEPFKKPGDK